MFFRQLLLLYCLAVYSALVAGRSCSATRPKHVIHKHHSHASSSALPTNYHGSVKSIKAAHAAVSVKASTTVGSSVPTMSSERQSSQTGSAGSSPSSSKKFIGLGTRYGDGCTEEDCWQDGACSFVGYDLPEGIDGSTCVSADIWKNGANCGGCISVTYKGKTITVMVTNETGGNATHLDMTPATWAKLTNGYSGGGVDGIEWEWITCPIPDSTPLWIKMHGGASKYWFAATVENARERTSALEVSSDQGASWKAAVLDNYNMWTLGSVLPADTAWVRVTSLSGSKVVVEDVKLSSGVVTKAKNNYS